MRRGENNVRFGITRRFDGFTAQGIERANQLWNLSDKDLPGARQADAASVSFKSGVPNHSSSEIIRRLNAGCVTYREAAAREN